MAYRDNTKMTPYHDPWPRGWDGWNMGARIRWFDKTHGEHVLISGMLLFETGAQREAHSNHDGMMVMIAPPLDKEQRYMLIDKFHRQKLKEAEKKFKDLEHWLKCRGRDGLAIDQKEMQKLREYHEALTDERENVEHYRKKIHKLRFGDEDKLAAKYPSQSTARNAEFLAEIKQMR